MCGIALVLARHPASATPGGDPGPALLDALRHRGPDAQRAEPCALGDGHHAVIAATRLAIRDPSAAAAQPFHVADGTAVLAYNGEIYEQPKGMSRAWRTRSDSEWVATAAAEHGAAAAGKLRGMFAWGFVRPADGTLLIARDRFGMKPLYLDRARPDGIAFASEIRPLLRTRGGTPTLSRAAIAAYLAYGSVQEPWTIVEGIEAVPAGTTLEWRAGVLGAPQRYWKPGAMAGASRDPDALAEVLAVSVRLHTVSDRPVGVFLSGGVDSSLIAALLRAGGQEVRTLAVATGSGPMSDLAVARDVARHLQTQHVEVDLTDADVVESLDRFLAAQDQPSADGWNTFIVSEAARRQGLVVCLSGLGGDEFFGGYHTGPLAQRMARLGRWPSGAWLARTYARLRLAADDPRRRKINEWPGGRSLVEAHAFTRMLFTPTERAALLGEPGAEGPLAYAPAVRERLENEIAHLDPDAAIGWLEAATYMRNTLLRDTDVMSMAHGIEVRTPFVDHVVLERLLALPRGARPHGKGILKRLLARHVPRDLWDRPKRGFTLPLDRWIAGPLRDRVRGVVCEAGKASLAVEAKRAVWARFERDPARMATRVWALFVLEEWCARAR